MAGTRSGVRVALDAAGVASTETGLSVLDHLIGELARVGRFRITLEVAPDTASSAVAAAGEALGGALAELLAAPRASGFGWAIVPADEALASAAVDRGDAARLVTNVDFSEIRIGGVAEDVVSRFLEELARAADVNLHVRLLEGDDPQHVLTAIFRAVGAALGQACRPAPISEGEESS
jgi:imidazoleglycerol-phosphate dehydratase